MAPPSPNAKTSDAKCADHCRVYADCESHDRNRSEHAAIAAQKIPPPHTCAEQEETERAGNNREEEHAHRPRLLNAERQRLYEGPISVHLARGFDMLAKISPVANGGGYGTGAICSAKNKMESPKRARVGSRSSGTTTRPQSASSGWSRRSTRGTNARDR